MKSLADDADYLEIIGFDGGTRIDCGRFQPIVHNKKLDVFFKLSSHRYHRNAEVYSAEEMEDLLARGIVTRFKAPLAFQENTIVAYFSNAFLVSVEEDIPSDLIRTGISLDGMAVLLKEERSLILLDHYARVLMEKVTKLITAFFSEKEVLVYQAAKENIKFARQAAQSKELRSNIFLRVGLIEKLSGVPEKLENIFRHRIKKEFPEWEWTSFNLGVSRLIQNLQERAMVLKIETHGQIEPNHLIININNLLATVADSGTERPLEEYVDAANHFRCSYAIDEKQIKKLADKMRASDRVVPNSEELAILATEPAFYLYSKTNNKHPVSLGDKIFTFQYSEAGDILQRRDLYAGRVAALLSL